MIYLRFDSRFSSLFSPFLLQLFKLNCNCFPSSHGVKEREKKSLQVGVSPLAWLGRFFYASSCARIRFAALIQIEFERNGEEGKTAKNLQFGFGSRFWLLSSEIIQPDIFYIFIKKNFFLVFKYYSSDSGLPWRGIAALARGSFTIERRSLVHWPAIC